MLDVIRQKSQSFGVKIIFGIIILVFVFWGASSVNTGSTQALAKVNDVEINAMDFNLEYRKQAETLRSIPGFSSLDSERREALGQYVLQQMISREIVRQEGVKLGLGTSDTELSYLVVKTPQFLDADGKFSQDIYKAVLASSGMTPGIYERSLSNEIMEYKLRDYIGASVSLSPEEAHQTFRFDFERRIVEYILFPSADYSARVKPEEKEIAEYYEANKETFAIPPMADFDYLIFNAESLSDSVTFTEAELQEYYEQNISSFEEPERYHVRHILIAVPASIADDDAITKEALEKAGKAKAELAAGKSFAAVALEYSDDSQSRQNGGDLDWLEKGQTEQVFEDAVLALKPGETGGPVRTSYGVHILRLDEVKAATRQSFAEVKNEIIKMKKEDVILHRLDEIQQEVEDIIITKKDLDILAQQYKLTAGHTGLHDLDALAVTLGVNVNTFTSIASVQPGTVLPMPIDLKEGFIVLKLNAYIAGSVPSVDSVRTEISDILNNRGALKLALEDADKLAEQIAASAGELPTKMRGRVKESRAVDRVTGLSELGFSSALTQAVFTAKPGQWLSSPFSIESGAVLVKVKEAVPPLSAEWEEKRNAYTEKLQSDRRNVLFNAYFGMVVKNSKIEVLVDRIFQN